LIWFDLIWFLFCVSWRLDWTNSQLRFVQFYSSQWSVGPYIALFLPNMKTFKGLSRTQIIILCLLIDCNLTTSSFLFILVCCFCFLVYCSSVYWRCCCYTNDRCGCRRVISCCCYQLLLRNQIKSFLSCVSRRLDWTNSQLWFVRFCSSQWSVGPYIALFLPHMKTCKDFPYTNE